MTSKVKRKWSELNIRDKKFTCITVVDFGVVKSTRMKRTRRSKAGKNKVVDNREKLIELSSKGKTSFNKDTKDKKVIVRGKIDKKKKKRENEQEYKKEDSSVPKRKKTSWAEQSHT